MTRKKLPIGIQSLAKIREGNYYYVDKTPFVARLAEDGTYYFLSRPRRFGKSLFLDTLAEAFRGNRELFTRLYLEHSWDWSKRHPVICISFAEGRLESRADLDRRIRKELAANATRLGVSLDDPDDIAGSFGQLISRAAEQYNERTVVLVDEYDKPILDNLSTPDIATQMREGLRNLYSVIKGRDADIRFVFLTGVSKFSKVSLFSGLNNLQDITLHPHYGAICGYTEDDVDTVFAPELDGLNREEIRRWYNGYRWDGPAVYNPFDLLLLFDSHKFRPWWFETATPTFLVEWLKQRGFFTPRLERMYSTEALLSAFDVDRMEPEALLWQTGYLTIHETHVIPSGMAYSLGLPNHEVRSALNEALVSVLMPNSSRSLLVSGLEVYQWLARGDAGAVHGHVERLFASIPYQWYRNNPMTNYEGYWASVFYSHFAALGVVIGAEDTSNEGQCDLVVRSGSTIWVFEFKVIKGAKPTGTALAQLQAKNYAAKYKAPGVTVREVGVEFSRTKRQIVGWEVA